MGSPSDYDEKIPETSLEEMDGQENSEVEQSEGEATGE